ncbi:hypothetical protein REPUB_Repub13aG0121200 [Reevesia pubescens]
MSALIRQEAATAFVKSYYSELSQYPGNIHKFYKDSSILSRLGPDGVLYHWSISEAMDNNVVFDCKKFLLLSIDTQLSIVFGIHILVIGWVIMKDNSKRKFTQSFVLSPTNKPNVYLILNDVLRFLDEEETADSSLEAVQEVQKVASEKLKPNHVDEVDSMSNLKEAVQEVQNNDVATAATCVKADDSPADPSLDVMPADDHIVPSEDEVPKDAIAAAAVACVEGVDSNKADDIAPNKAVQEVDNDAIAAAPKRSFLTIVNGLNENKAPFKAAPVRKSVPIKTKEAKGNSIFVGNLAMNVKVEELYLAFKKFGAIKQNGIKIRADHMNNRCFAFVEFESSNSAQTAIQASSSIEIGNRKVHIQEKKISNANNGNTKFPPASSNIGNGLLTR